MKNLILTVFIVACGPAEFQKPSNEQVSDAIGASANHARKHLSDRGVSGGAIQDVGTKAGKKANKVRQTWGDSGITSEKVSKEISTRDDVAGEYANDKRKGLYRKGIKEVRHGDQDTQDTIRENHAASEEANNTQDNNTTTFVEDLQSQLDDLSNSLAGLADLVDESVAALYAAIETLGEDLLSLINENEAAIKLEENTRVSELEELLEASEASDAEIEALIATSVADLETLIDDLDAEVDAEVERLDRKDRALVRSARHQSRQLGRLQRQSRCLERRIRFLERRSDEVCTIRRVRRGFTKITCPSGSLVTLDFSRP